MGLEELVLADLESIDLKGVKILNLSCATEETNVSFEISDTIIDFIAKNEEDFTVTSLTRNGQTYTNEEILSKCDGWVNYVGKIINPIIKKHRDELEKAVITAEETAEPIQAIGEETSVTEVDVPRAIIEHINEIENEASEKEEQQEEKVEIADKVENESIQEAEARGHKEGYKVARMKNVQDIKKLKKKYRFILFFTIIVLLGIFAAIWILVGPGFVF